MRPPAGWINVVATLALIAAAGCVAPSEAPAPEGAGGAGGAGGGAGAPAGGAGGLPAQDCTLEPSFVADDRLWIASPRGVSDDHGESGFGQALAIGRLDDDELDDVVIGLPLEGFDEALAHDRRGHVVVIFGPRRDLDLAGPTTEGRPPWLVLAGDRAAERLGSSLALLPRGDHGALAIGSGPQPDEGSPPAGPGDGQRAFLLDGVALRALATAEGASSPISEAAIGAAAALFSPAAASARGEAVRVARVPRSEAAALLLVSRPDSLDATGVQGEVVLVDPEVAFVRGTLDPAQLPLRARIRGASGDGAVGWLTATGRTRLALGAPRGPRPGAFLVTLPAEEEGVVEEEALERLAGPTLEDPVALPGESFAVHVTPDGARLFVTAPRAAGGAVAVFELDQEGRPRGPPAILRAPVAEVVEFGRGLAVLPDGTLVVSAPGATVHDEANAGLVFGVPAAEVPTPGGEAPVHHVASFRVDSREKGAMLGYRIATSTDGRRIWLSGPTWEAGRLVGLAVAGARACTLP